MWATKKCIGNDLEKLQHINNEHQRGWGSGRGGGLGGEVIQNTLIVKVGKQKIAGAFEHVDIFVPADKILIIFYFHLHFL